MPDTTIEIRPREHFRPYIERTQRWACLVVHRRGGKTYICIQDLIFRALTHARIGPPLRYAYVAPTRDQAKDIAWGYLVSFASQIPGVEMNKADLMVALPNKATIRLYSGESYERMRGLYFDGVVIDEGADMDPAAWDSVIRPCLTDYNGWATFIGTPKGRNAFWKIHCNALENPDWFSLVLRASESGIIAQSEISALKAGMTEAMFAQEFECDFSVGRPGAIYSRLLDAARQGKRVTDDVLWFRELPVYTAFDVGAPHNQKCWIFQLCGDRINFLESLTGGNDCSTPADWAGRLKAKQYQYGGHFLPHDAMAENGGLWQDGMSKAGLVGIAGVPRQHSVWDGIHLGLDSFNRCYFNRSGCADGLEALDAYHAREERDGATIRDVPVHDWSSHFSDAFSICHQAIRAGLIVDRSAIATKPINKKPVVITYQTGNRTRELLEVINRKPRVLK